MENAPGIKTPLAADIDVLARTIYGEARSETLAGQIAVAFVIIHRARAAFAFAGKFGKPHPLYGDGAILAACKAHEQFSCWNVGDPNYAKINSVTLSDPAFQVAMYVATGAVNRLLSDALPRSMYYFAPGLIAPPAWATQQLFLATMGSQRFYAEPPAAVA